ncbi:MAG TPA: hypothetical protein VNB22_12540, partial [Pyrinomonadaceae bacterium]|nr:hypothetical protein [Pyrinomonadaceae bacterium]
MFYTVVLLDGKEIHCLTAEEVKDLFLKRQLNQNSLVCSTDDPNWQMLKRAFDLSQWIQQNAPHAPQVNSENPFQAQNNPFEQSNPFNQPSNFLPQNNSFEQSNPVDQPVTFNQFPPNQPNSVNDPYAQNTSNGYSQNNQTETYYQAETSQSQYNFQNNQPNVAPSKYNNAANSYHNPANPYGYSSNLTNSDENRNGLRQAAVFLIAWTIFTIIYTLMDNITVSSTGTTNSGERVGGGIVGLIVSLAINIILAIKLWKKEDVENARKWTLIRTYLGFVIFGIGLPLTMFGKGEIFLGVINFVAYFLFLVSILLVLHGKEGPSQNRVMIGMGTFALFFLFNFGIIALSSIVMFAPNLSNLDIADKHYDNYKIEGKEYVDKTNGAKVVLPEGWSMISLD